MDNNTTMIALVAIVAIVLIGALVLIQPHSTTQVTQATQPQGQPAGATPQGTQPTGTTNGTPSGGTQPAGTGTQGQTGTQDAGQSDENPPLEEPGETEVPAETESNETPEETEGAVAAALECTMSASGAAGGSVSGTAKVEGTNAAGDGTVAIPGFSTGMKFIVKGETAYLNFPTIKMISSTWYEVPVSELSAILFTTGYAENVSEEDLEEIDMIGMILGLGEITVTEDDLSDVEAIVTYIGQAGDRTSVV